ncbi:MAG: hypothetical protein LBU62_05740 [Bacteroidales bacterium]|nr:hypothetical protein [Bacteroidales bacterium]
MLQISAQSLQNLATSFQEPPNEYRPCVWWHWLGSNFRKEGITKDLEAMKGAGIGGATIFNIASSVQNSHAPIENNPWPHQTYRSEAYWDAFKHTLAEAKRLDMQIGLHGTPGYATTGGPWITEERAMQTIVMRKVQTTGNRLVEVLLEKPELPIYVGFESRHPDNPTIGQRRATYYRDIAVMAVPAKEGATVNDVIDISACMDANGLLKWQAPTGNWNICRIGHAPTMANPHPLPDDIIGKTLEVDKMSREHNVYHWQQVLNPLKERFKEYFGTTFTYIWIDSYESGDQDWTPLFREEFIIRKGYDPLPWIALRQFANEEDAAIKHFAKDYKEVVSRLFIDNGWQVAKEMIHEAGLQFYWEPYWGPFNTKECIAIPDIPIDEFWTGGSGRISPLIPLGARDAGKKIVAAEAFTGSPELSCYTEDPAFLKPTADGGFVSGINWLFLHHWVHQPFDDQYQPGMGMGWWGTHFSRYQTWLKPGKAFFTYLARCQMLLQQGGLTAFESRNVLHRSMPEAELFFVINPSAVKQTKPVAFPVKNRIPELWDANKGSIRQTQNWKAAGDSIYIDLKLEANESVFVVFPKSNQCNYSNLRLPPVDVISETAVNMDEKWTVLFQPKLAPPFQRKFTALTDFSKNSDTAIKYFAGTASYTKTIHISASDIKKGKRIAVDLGELHDIAELEVNGEHAGVLWYPPYKADITPWLKSGNNTLTVHVTNNWANRLIGDEQYPADFEWGADRGAEGRAMKAFPDWFIKQQPRPEQGRKGFSIWYYFRPDSQLYPAGLLGPVRLIKQNVSGFEF